MAIANHHLLHLVCIAVWLLVHITCRSAVPKVHGESCVIHFNIWLNTNKVRALMNSTRELRHKPTQLPSYSSVLYATTVMFWIYTGNHYL